MRTLIPVTLIAALAAPLAGQSEKPKPEKQEKPKAKEAVVVGVVVDSAKAPLAGVDVVLEAPVQRVTTGADGRFTLAGVPLGITTAMFRKIGYRPVRLKTLIFDADTLEVSIAMRRAVVELEPLEVTASSVPPGMQEFAERRLRGFGSYLDAPLLRESEHRRLSDMLRNVRGVRVVLGRGNQYLAYSNRGSCPLAIFLDGAPFYRPDRRLPPPDINTFPVSNLEGVEVYTGPATIPPEYAGFNSSCGVILLWTRRS